MLRAEIVFFYSLVSLRRLWLKDRLYDLLDAIK
jgi:hypothetical protein